MKRLRACSGGSADWEFHTRVVDASGNTLLAELYRNLAEPLRTSMSSFWELPGFDGADPAGHEDLLAALRGHAPAAAARQADSNTNATGRVARLRRLNDCPDLG